MMFSSESAYYVLLADGADVHVDPHVGPAWRLSAAKTAHATDLAYNRASRSSQGAPSVLPCSAVVSPPPGMGE